MQDFLAEIAAILKFSMHRRAGLSFV